MDHQLVSAAAQPRAVRSYAASRFYLELDGKMMGFVSAVEGGEPVGDVILERPGPEHFSKKHIGGVRYTDVTLTLNLALDPAFYAWIDETWAGKAKPRNGRLYMLDLNLAILAEEEFANAMISEVTIPALDGSSKDPGYLTVKFRPEYTRYKKGSGSRLNAPAQAAAKQWINSNFRLDIPGLPTTRVARVEALTVKQSVARDPIGAGRDPRLEPTDLEFPNLVVSVSEADAQGWEDWAEDFLVKGNNADAQEKSGTLAFLAPDRNRSVLGKVSFSNLGIFHLAHDKNTAAADRIRRFTGEMYVERMNFSLGG
jgi:hypothetical protein